MWIKSLSSAVFQVRGNVDFLRALTPRPGAQERQSPQDTAMFPESNDDIRYPYLISLLRKTVFTNSANTRVTLLIIQYVCVLEIMRSNGFCLANTETIVFDHSLPEEKERPSSTDSAEHT